MTTSTATPTHAAFLRGMNLGKRRITNDELCAHFESMGFGAVAAFLASGNVVFAAPEVADEAALARRIEDGLRAALDYEVPTYVRSAAEVRALAAPRPFPAGTVESSEGKLQIALLAGPPATADRSAVLEHASVEDRLAFGERELYWLPAGPMSQSELDWRALERLLGPTTVRTARTFERLAAKYF